jgi:hypothetical protein
MTITNKERADAMDAISSFIGAEAMTTLPNLTPSIANRMLADAVANEGLAEGMRRVQEGEVRKAMMDMVENGAKGLYAQIASYGPHETWDELTELARDVHRHYAKACLRGAGVIK